jgi:hypothetical protein
MSVPTPRRVALTACVLTALMGLGACSDDGSEVREIGSDCASSASGSAASGSAASGSPGSTESSGSAASGSAASGSASAECEPATEESSSP